MSNTPQLVYSRRFDRDFSEILRYLRQTVSDRAADIIRDRVFEVIDSLPENPERYPPEPRLAHVGNYRVIRMRKAPYKIFYRYTEGRRSGWSEFSTRNVILTGYSGGLSFRLEGKRPFSRAYYG